MSDESLPVNTESGFRILIVDDNVGSAKILGMLFKKLGQHQVELAHCGRDAIVNARQFRPDVMVLDLMLGDMSGLDVARTIRQDEELGSTLLAALTGKGSPEDRRKSLEAGFHLHLVKPIGVEPVKEIITLLEEFQREGTSDE